MPEKFSGNIYVNNYCCLVFISRQQILRDTYTAHRQYLDSRPTPSVQTITGYIFPMEKEQYFTNWEIKDTFRWKILLFKNLWSDRLVSQI